MYFNDIKMHFVIMNNVFNTNIQVHYKYDLKGSTYQRLSRNRKEIAYDDFDFNIPMKDLDFKDRNEKIFLIDREKELICREICKDSEFLTSMNINDYSLLIGIHDPDYYNGNSSNCKNNLIEQLHQGFSQTVDIANTMFNGSNFDEYTKRNPFYEKHKGGILSFDGKKVYFLGIIDIFTAYGYNIINI
jgi:1-phosphatidylinositol-4-phosphate 5-kinase